MTSACNDGGSTHPKYFQPVSSVSETNTTDRGHQESLSHGDHQVPQFSTGHKTVGSSPADRQRHDSQKSCSSDVMTYPMEDFRRLLTGGESDGVSTVEEWFKIYRQANSKLLNTYGSEGYSDDKSSHSAYSGSIHGAKHSFTPLVHPDSRQRAAQFAYLDTAHNRASVYSDTRQIAGLTMSQSPYSEVRHNTGEGTTQSAYSDTRPGASSQISEPAYSEVRRNTGERMTQSTYSDMSQNQTPSETVTPSVHQNFDYNKSSKRSSSSYSEDSDSGKIAESVMSNVDQQTGEKRPRYVNSKFSNDSDQKMSQSVNTGSGSLVRTDSANGRDAKQPSASQELQKGDNSQAEESIPACWVCHEKFSKMSNLIRHVKTHEEGHGHQCHVCGRRFTRGDSLIRHSRIHTGVKPYTCTLCGRSFTMSGSLKSHTLVHTKERRFKCDVCLKTFSRSDTLLRHSQTHVTESSLECGICAKKFRNASVLRSHVQRHMEDEKKLTCFDCDKVFSRPDSLTRHKQSHCLKTSVLKRPLATRRTKIGSYQEELKDDSMTREDSLSQEDSMKQNAVDSHGAD